MSRNFVLEIEQLADLAEALKVKADLLLHEANPPMS
jgi:hypothetical protein